MRRVFLILTVAALMAAMMVTAGPAKADVNLSSDGSSFGGVNSSNFDNGAVFISVNSSFDDIDFGGIAFDGDFEID